MDGSWTGVEEIREGYTILCTDLMSDNDFIDVVELIPIFIVQAYTVTIQRLELRTCDISGQNSCD